MLAANCTLDSVDSTNTHARALMDSGASHGTWIAAHTQTTGRGRTGRQWISQPGNLHLSILLRVTRPDLLSWVPLAVAVFAAQEIQKLGDSRVRLKWPNDLWVSTGQGLRKVGGILCEGHTQSGQSTVIVGIGINCAVAPPDAARLSGISSDLLCEVLVKRIPPAWREIESCGVEGLKADFEALSLTPPGAAVLFCARLVDQDEPSSEPARYWQSARALGLGQNGELWVWSESESRKRALFSEEVSLRPTGGFHGGD